jgi:hypothetical protein
MVFWISCAVVALIIVWSIVRAIRFNDAEEAWPLIVAFFVAGAMAVVIGIGSTNPPGLHPVLAKRYGLHALVTKDESSSQIAGSFFLGFGGVVGSSSTKTKIVYIRTDRDGGSTIHDTTVGRSVIYEDVEPGGKPYVEDWVSGTKTGTAWVPWTWNYVKPGEPQHRFHIPKGSILSNYEVNP